ncbi:hypothetical protein AMS68_004844 [Peltaster fructicola]|uniref:Uncharacterized protein n=1 Tax=Peltaster fructicola TaxID=286661 RepID=A0A6H0XX29_9PEZI|nr:hypothetical protein AMS68_004844 [Peltaster fructicola]
MCLSRRATFPSGTTSLDIHLSVAQQQPSKGYIQHYTYKGVYDALHTRPVATGPRRQHGSTVAFIHRPFNLDRYRVPRHAGVVLSSHKSLDEVLTTGWNVQLAQRLGLSVDRSVCIQGYKGDPERRIGLVGPVESTEQIILQAIHREFGAWEGCFGFTTDVSDKGDIKTTLGAPIKAVALMNAFHPEEIERVIDSAVSARFITSAADCAQILYLTGAVRQPGLEAVLAKGIRTVCVGHKVCEDWGIRFLAAQTRTHFPELEVVEVDEPEEPRLFPTKVAEDVQQPVV